MVDLSKFTFNKKTLSEVVAKHCKKKKKMINMFSLSIFFKLRCICQVACDDG